MLVNPFLEEGTDLITIVVSKVPEINFHRKFDRNTNEFNPMR